jgi:hypothetical protein
MKRKNFFLPACPAAVKKLQPGNTVLFGNIKLQGTDGCARTMNDLLITIK